jgi:hypothetical protein
VGHDLRETVPAASALVHLHLQLDDLTGAEMQQRRYSSDDA